MQRRMPRTASPERWAQVSARAITEDVQMRQVGATGQWMANSGTDPHLAYLVGITGGIAHDCTCLAGQHDDPVCKHRAAYDLLIGMLAGPDDSGAPALVA
jgi:hypothetical protein